MEKRAPPKKMTVFSVDYPISFMLSSLFLFFLLCSLLQPARFCLYIVHRRHNLLNSFSSLSLFLLLVSITCGNTGYIQDFECSLRESLRRSTHINDIRADFGISAACLEAGNIVTCPLPGIHGIQSHQIEKERLTHSLPSDGLVLHPRCFARWCKGVKVLLIFDWNRWRLHSL